MREKGFYWIKCKLDNSWYIDYWDGEYFENISEDALPSEASDYIVNEKRILNPDETVYYSLFGHTEYRKEQKLPISEFIKAMNE